MVGKALSIFHQNPNAGIRLSSFEGRRFGINWSVFGPLGPGNVSRPVPEDPRIF